MKPYPLANHGSPLLLLALTGLSLPLQAALTPSEQELATALTNACNALQGGVGEGGPINPPPFTAARNLVGENNLRNACNAIRNADSRTAFEDAVKGFIPIQIPAQGTSSIEVSNRQFDNITARMQALRSGARGISTSGLSLQGFAPSDHLATSGRLSGGSAGADETPLVGGLGVFINGSLSTGDKDSSDSELGFDFDTQGLTAGVDYRFSDKLIVGGAVGYVNNVTDFVSNRGDMGVDGYTLSLYATYYHDQHGYLDAIASLGWNDFTTNRRVDPGSGIPAAIVSGDTQGTEYTLSVGGGYDFNRGGLSFGPFARVNYISADIDSYTENTSTGFEFDYDDQSVQSLRTHLGAQLSYAISTSRGILSPQLRAEWAHEFQDDSRFITARFLNDPTQTQFSLHTDNPDRNFFNLGVGLTATFAEGRSAFLYYEKTLKERDLNQESIAAGVRLTF